MSGSQCAACDEVPMCAGRSPVSVSSVSECDRFRAVAAEHATLFATFAGNEGGDVSSNASSSNASDVSSSDSGSSSSSSIRIASGSNVSNPECYDSLAYFFCAQHPIEDETQATPPRASSCLNHQRPLSGHLHKCYGFCEPLLRACGSDAHFVREHCLTECRQNHGGSMCSVLRIDGVPTSYIDRLQDINGKFGLSLEAQQPVFRNGRPLYRSIPSRRSDGSSRIDYFLYSTRARGFDEWIHRAGTALWQNQPPGVPRQALSTLFECAEHLANEAVAQDSARKPIFFLATDSPHVEQLAKLVYSRRKNDPESSLRPQLVSTQYDAVHSMQANTVTKQVGIAADWWLLTMVDELVAPGSIQSTFSGSAWHVSLRADQLKHVDYRGKCLRGGGPPFNVWGLPDYPNRGEGYYRHDDAALSALRNGPPEIELKIHHEL